MDEDDPVRLHRLPPRLLAQVLSATPARRLSPRQRDQLAVPTDAWAQVAEDAEHHVVGLLLARRLHELGLDDALPDDVRASWAADARHARLQHAAQTAGAVRLSAELSRRGVRHSFLKGFSYRLLHYRPAWVRLGGDIDLLVDRADVEAVRVAMRSLGFTQASCSHEYQHYRPAAAYEIATTESRHHEMAQFVRDLRLHGGDGWLLRPPFRQRVPFAFEALDAGPTFHCCVDIHWALHFLFVDADPLADVVDAPVPGTDGVLPVLAPHWNLLFTSFKLYVESFDRPRFGWGLLADLVALARSDLDWDALAGLGQRFGLEAALFYTTSAAERLAGGPLVPGPLAREWARPAPPGPGADLDLGDFVTHLVGERVPARFLADRR